ncbi:MAG: alpha/beta fold hydrolase [Candidatus Odinarchaeota archaeon]
MSKVKVNDVELEYDTFGDPSSRPLLLIMGLGAQMIAWDEKFCQKLVEQDFFVIRFDNRDVGLSTKFEEAGLPNLKEAFKKREAGELIPSPYKIEDMADDAVGLLSALNIDKAHICGASMGGMIAQIIAYKHPSRVLSLTSIMSSTGNPDLPQAKPEAMNVLFKPLPDEREAYIKASLENRRIIHGTGLPFDEEKACRLVAASYDRSYYRPGFIRQLVAIWASGNRKDALKTITAPTLVIHGEGDPLVPVEGGKDTAEAIPGAELLLIDGMGHSLPIQVWSIIFDAISKNAAKASQ